jgi:hypothetical protein
VKALGIVLIVMTILVGLVLGAQGQIETTYEIGAILLPHLNMTYLGRNQTGGLLLYSQEVPGNYIICPKIGTNKWSITWQGVTYTLIGINDSTITIRRSQ